MIGEPVPTALRAGVTDGFADRVEVQKKNLCSASQVFIRVSTRTKLASILGQLHVQGFSACANRRCENPAGKNKLIVRSHRLPKSVVLVLAAFSDLY
jgi:hypothetical protein